MGNNNQYSMILSVGNLGEITSKSAFKTIKFESFSRTQPIKAKRIVKKVKDDEEVKKKKNLAKTICMKRLYLIDEPRPSDFPIAVSPDSPAYQKLQKKRSKADSQSSPSYNSS